VLDAATKRPSDRPPLDDEQVAAVHDLERDRDRLRRELRQVADQRGLLSDEGADELDYTRAVESQLTRLYSLNLLGDGDGDGASCAVCGSELPEPDPTSADLRAAVEQLQSQLVDVEAARPRREAVLAELDAHGQELREQLRGTEAALSGLASTQDAAHEARERAEEQAFTKGRISQYLSSLAATEDQAMRTLRETVANARRRVETLESDVDPERVQDELFSRLVAVSNDMTRYANALELEHAEGSVRLDLGRLTVVTDTDDSGPAPLMRIGSGENWVGYHLATHLALHRFFARRDRPVPRFLMLDQPTQVFYPSDVEIEEGLPAGEETRLAVRRLYTVMRDFVAELDGTVQLIVCDHANLPEEWFQDAVRENWRDGRKMIPDEWIDRASRN
jgi:DNA repair exonuclease SbcCD ATPase subunit